MTKAPQQMNFTIFSLATFTVLLVAISLAAIASGFIVIFGLIASKRLNGLSLLILATTVATSMTGFGFRIMRFTPGLALGGISLVTLSIAIYTRYVRHLSKGCAHHTSSSRWCRSIFNVFVLIVQAFQKMPFLKVLAPTQTDWLFALG